MLVCKACNIEIAPGTGSGFCPLCGTELRPMPPEGPAPQPGAGPSASLPALPGNAYPDLAPAAARTSFVLRMMVFFSALCGGVCVLTNLLAGPRTLWSVIVLAGLLYLWLTIPPLLRRRINYAKRAVVQVAVTSALMILLDLLVGYSGWSVSYVIPGLLCAGIVSVGLLAVFNRTNWAQYVFYQVLMGAFAFLPLPLYLTGLAANVVMVIITAALGLASLLVTLIFGDRSIKSEFKRRFHF